MVIRRIKENDLEKLLLLYRHLHEDDTPASKDDLEKVWKEIFENDSIIYFVIELDGLLVSSCNLTIIPNLTRGGRPFGLIENVVTHSDYRNKGLGKSIMETAIDFAKSKNCYKVMLLSAAVREEAHEFYEKLGFSSQDKVGYAMKLPN